MEMAALTGEKFGRAGSILHWIGRLWVLARICSALFTVGTETLELENHLDCSEEPLYTMHDLGAVNCVRLLSHCSFQDSVGSFKTLPDDDQLTFTICNFNHGKSV